ncbi:head-tail adaptor protein [Pseudomonas corrugata]|uniref:phage head completion protein n=1 Tax=Pseudomonas corrugata TaxID=47879 RepID=UPI00083D831F|nr:head-tail adaptor protein [Pseudomonas corrugata]AOE63787.1 phage head-tail joining protein [Pseudomonas corrugata]
MGYREPTIGEMKRRVAVRLRTDTPAADMGLDSSFSVLKGIWARIEPVGTATYTDGVQTDVKITHRISIRLLNGITDAHEIVHVRKGAGGGYEVVPDTPLYRVKRSADMNDSRRFTLLDVEEMSPAQSGTGIYV